MRLTTILGDGGWLVDEAAARPEEQVRRAGSWQDVEDFYTDSQLLRIGNEGKIRVLRTIDAHLIEAQHAALRVLGPAGGLAVPEDHTVHIRTGMDKGRMHEVIRPRDGTVLLQMRILRFIRENALSYALFLRQDDETGLVIRTVDPRVITRLWIDGGHVQSSEWRGERHSRPPDGRPLRAGINLDDEGPLRLQELGPDGRSWWLAPRGRTERTAA